MIQAVEGHDYTRIHSRAIRRLRDVRLLVTAHGKTYGVGGQRGDALNEVDDDVVVTYHEIDEVTVGIGGTGKPIAVALTVFPQEDTAGHALIVSPALATVSAIERGETS